MTQLGNLTQLGILLTYIYIQHPLPATENVMFMSIDVDRPRVIAKGYVLDLCFCANILIYTSNID